MDEQRTNAAAALRVTARAPVRQAKRQILAEFLGGANIDPALIDPIDRQRTRAQLLNLENVGGSVGDSRQASRKLYEAVIGTDDTLPRRFLGLGELAARSVGRMVVLTPGGEALFGTGSLISQRLAITNHHVLQSSDQARQAVLELGYYQTGPGEMSTDRHAFPLDPDTFFWTSEALDYSIVAVRPEADGATTAQYGRVEMIAQSGKAVIGERVNIIHHPGGQPQSISIRENTVADMFDQWVHYVADTSPGSSGAAVFNDEWQLVAIHHAAVPSGAEGIVNEGIRVSAIVDDLAQSGV